MLHVFWYEPALGTNRFEQHLCNLSYLVHLQIYYSTVEEQLSIMEAYNIGENSEFLRFVSDPNYEVFLRTPKLKKLRKIDLVPFPPDVCPILETSHYNRGFSYMEINGEAIKLDYAVWYIFFSSSNLPETTLQIQSREDFRTFHCPE